MLLSLLILPSLLMAQSDRRSFDLSVEPQFRDYFLLDHFGLRLINEGLPLESYLDAETYELGPNDVLSLEMSGGMERAMRGLVINPEGAVFIPGLGKVSFRDKTLTEAREHVTQLASQSFGNTQVSLTLDIPRPIHVHIHGDVESPGRYLLPFGIRLDQAIFRALISPGANPDRTGMFQYDSNFIDNQNLSLRNIHIQKKDESTLTGDLVHYFRTGELEANPVISHGDRIVIRRRISEAPVVSISGAVHLPLTLEYREDDNLERLLDMAGGFTPDAKSDEIIIHSRTANGLQRRTISTDETNLSQVYLNPNDRVVIPMDRNLHQAQNTAVHGEVQLPGTYPIIEGETTVADLLEMSGGITNRALAHGAYLIRATHSSDRVLRDGGVNAEILQRASDQLVQGLEYLQMESTLFRNQIPLDVNNAESLAGIKVYHGDRIFIPRDEHTVIVLGQVNKPGLYAVDEANSAREFVQLAGGFTIAAEESRVFIIKAGSRSWYRPGEVDVESGDIIFVDREPYDELHSRRMFRNSNIQLIMTGITTLATVITTYAVYRRN